MKKLLLTFILLAFMQSIMSQQIFPVDAEYRADIKIFKVDRDYQADLLVYMVNRNYRADGNTGLWYFTDKEYRAEVKVFFVNRDYQADLKVYFVDREYMAGWRDTSKKHILETLLKK
ncbi:MULTISPECIES: DUF6150 family protein [Flavobacteriaceae]|uniref:DUF6150 family protein n=1 Tax=Flavobacteriaceae TaxID=49546 RepID=UPI001C0F216D|nr:MULTISPECIES: DUF6150 family protein [Allomuricauda]MDC6365835.1 DUF6150 family protein [Muricauda sp. AC10]